MSNSSIWDWTLSGDTTVVQSGPGSNGNEGVLYIPQSSRARVLPSDCLMSYLFGEVSYPFAQMQSVCSKAPADWASKMLHIPGILLLEDLRLQVINLTLLSRYCHRKSSVGPVDKINITHMTWTSDSSWEAWLALLTFFSFFFSFLFPNIPSSKFSMSAETFEKSRNELS